MDYKDISAERLMAVTALETGAGYVARFTTDEGLRGFGQSLIQHQGGTFGILIMADGRIPQEREARAILMPHLAEREEVIATVQLAFDCSAAASLHDQGRQIHDNITRLLGEDMHTDVACVTVSIAHLSPEAETYGNVEPSNVPSIQAERMGETLADHYGDIENTGEQLPTRPTPSLARPNAGGNIGASTGPMTSTMNTCHNRALTRPNRSKPTAASLTPPFGPTCWKKQESAT